jgi:hypothetical protein
MVQRKARVDYCELHCAVASLRPRPARMSHHKFLPALQLRAFQRTQGNVGRTRTLSRTATLSLFCPPRRLIAWFQTTAPWRPPQRSACRVRICQPTQQLQIVSNQAWWQPSGPNATGCSLRAIALRERCARLILYGLPANVAKARSYGLDEQSQTLLKFR